MPFSLQRIKATVMLLVKLAITAFVAGVFLYTAVRFYPECPDLFTYPLCPRCALPMEREYQRFCEHCGQALDWDCFSKAVIVIS